MMMCRTQAVVYRTRRRDTSDISTDLRKAEVFINNRGALAGPDGASFQCWENFRWRAGEGGGAGA